MRTFWLRRLDLNLYRANVVCLTSCGAQKLLSAWSAGNFWPLRFLTLPSSATGGGRDVTSGTLRSLVQNQISITRKILTHQKVNEDFLVAEAGLEPTTFGLWARRATNCSTPRYLVAISLSLIIISQFYENATPILKYFLLIVVHQKNIKKGLH